MRECFSFVRNEFVFSGVVVLLLICSPSAVFRAVISICIDSIKRHSFWLVAHVFDKVFKRINPSVTDRDASTAVQIELRVSRVRASLFHCGPAFVFSGFCSAMNKAAAAGRFCGVASTGNCRSTSKVVSGNLLFIPARAFAKPTNSFTGVFDSTNHSKPPKNTAGNVFCCSHFVTSKLVTIDVWQAVVKLLFGSYPSQKLGF